MNKPLAFIIEDDIEIRQIFTLALEPEFETSSFYDGHTALSALQQVIPTIIILDLNMPGLSGQVVLQKVRADERLATIPVILATADAVQARDLSEDADIVLVKPISPIQLRDLASRIRLKSG